MFVRTASAPTERRPEPLRSSLLFGLCSEEKKFARLDLFSERQSSPCKTVLAAPGPDVVATWVTPQRCRNDGGLCCRGRYHESKFPVNRFQERLGARNSRSLKKA